MPPLLKERGRGEVETAIHRDPSFLGMTRQGVRPKPLTFTPQ